MTNIEIAQRNADITWAEYKEAKRVYNEYNDRESADRVEAAFNEWQLAHYALLEAGAR